MSVVAARNAAAASGDQARDRRASSGVEGSQSCSAVGEQAGASAAAAARGQLPVVVGEIRPLIAGAIKVASPEASRAGCCSSSAVAVRAGSAQTSKTLAATIQVLLPGETRAPHRHTMNALRFVLEGSGAITMVDGKPCPMEEGDLILTPAWTWHEHVHQRLRANHVARCARRATPPLHGDRRVPAGAGGRAA